MAMNPILRIQRWMETRGGQKFMNYAYSWGAAVVILGTLFKLTHIPGANLMLFIGMGTEVFVFVVAGFDLSGIKARDPKKQAEIDAGEMGLELNPAVNPAEPNGLPALAGVAELQSAVPTEVEKTIVAGRGNVTISGDASITGSLTGNVNLDPLAEANEAYIEQLKNLTETLGKVGEQAQRMSTDSVEMENLNRTLTGINTIYEMQLKSISTQVGTIDSINEQTRRMAKQIEELNGIYARMIQAMTTNMPGVANAQ